MIKLPSVEKQILHNLPEKSFLTLDFKIKNQPMSI